MERILNYKKFSLNELRIQRFKYEVISEEPIENLYKYKDHRRLKVFYYKGVKCVSCDKVGEIITHSIDKMGNNHIDVVTKDYFPMTIDHIIPKSKGGSSDLSNLDPMCSICNSIKGDKDKNDSNNYTNKNTTGMTKNTGMTKIYDVGIGDIVYKRGKRENSAVFLGEIIEIKPNNKHPKNAMSAVIKERDKDSLYDLKLLFKIQ